MTIEGYGGRDRVLLSYDVSRAPRGKRVHVCHIVFGRTRRDRRGHLREEDGFIHRPGVVWIGQSVLIMPQKDAEDLARRLRPLGVHVVTAPVSIERAFLERFRRRHMA